MVSTPNYDPIDPPNVSKDDNSEIYINKFISNRYVPGSTFKLVTAMAAMETIGADKKFSYYCKGSEQYGNAKVDTVKCMRAHGQVDLKRALEVSCNCAFGKLATKVGKDKMDEYSKKAGLLSRYSINGIKTLPSSLEFTDGTVALAWAGIGQYHDMVNPCSMMIYMGAIANGGKTALPSIIQKLKLPSGLPETIEDPGMSEELISPKKAKKLSEYMRNDVTANYGQYNFPNLEIYAKSGTAELGNGKQPHAWFVGFIKNKHYPYAFVTLVENGGYGSKAAGSVTNKVMQQVISTSSLKYK
jgi:peptidoglycan glycosyltransferase